MLWPNLRCWLVWYDAIMLILLYLIVWWKSRMIFLLKIKQDKFLDGHITYQSHMWKSKYKPSTYACLWPIEFCQIVVTLGRIFSCFHDRDHVYPHIHANSYTENYAKHALHPPKISTPSSKEISLLAKGYRGHWKKEYMLKKHRKNVIQSKSIEKRKVKHDPPPK
jgi:hypothetical protein